MTDRELFAQAVVALEYHTQQTRSISNTNLAIEALRARLARWEKLNMNDHKEGDLGIGTVKWDASAPLVVHLHPAFQAIQPQPSEPDVCCQDFEKCVRSCTPRGQWFAEKEAQRSWQGLTDEQVKQIEKSASSTLSAIYLAEAQLKGKNGY